MIILIKSLNVVEKKSLNLFVDVLVYSLKLLISFVCSSITALYESKLEYIALFTNLIIAMRLFAKPFIYEVIYIDFTHPL